MCNFKIGEKVCCINPVGKLIKNEIYTIEQLINCHLCGDLKFVLVGVDKSENGYYKYQSCGKCGKGVNHVNGYRAIRFRKLDHKFAEDVIAYITELETVNI